MRQESCLSFTIIPCAQAQRRCLINAYWEEWKKKGRERRTGMRDREREWKKEIKEANYRANKWISDFIILLRLSSLLQIAKEPNLVISQHAAQTNSITFWFYLSRENCKQPNYSKISAWVSKLGTSSQWKNMQILKIIIAKAKRKHQKIYWEGLLA